MDLGFSLEKISRSKRARGDKGRAGRIAEERGRAAYVGENENSGNVTGRGGKAEQPPLPLSKMEQAKMLDSIVVHRKEDLEEIPEEESKAIVKIVVKLLNQIRDEPEKPRFPKDSRDPHTNFKERKPQRKAPRELKKSNK